MNPLREGDGWPTSSEVGARLSSPLAASHFGTSTRDHFRLGVFFAGGAGFITAFTENTGFAFSFFSVITTGVGTTTAAYVTPAQSAANVDADTGAAVTAAPGAASDVLYRCAIIARSRKSTAPSPLKSPSAQVFPPPPL